MPSVHINNVGGMAIVKCGGKFVRNEAAFKLRDAVTSQTNARVVVLDLTNMHAIGGGSLGMLVLLQRWHSNFVVISRSYIQYILLYHMLNTLLSKDI